MSSITPGELGVVKELLALLVCVGVLVVYFVKAGRIAFFGHEAAVAAVVDAEFGAGWTECVAHFLSRGVVVEGVFVVKEALLVTVLVVVVSVVFVLTI